MLAVSRGGRELEDLRLVLVRAMEMERNNRSGYRTIFTCGAGMVRRSLEGRDGFCTDAPALSWLKTANSRHC